MSTPTPRNLDELRAITDPAERACAAIAYINARDAAIVEARGIRDDAIRALLDHHGVTETARMVGLSRSHVKVVRGARS